MRAKRVLVLATSRKTRGGVTSVVSAYEHFPFWKEFDARWIETHIDRHLIWKLLYAFTALLKYLLCVWRYDIIHIHTSELPSVMRKYIFFKIAKLLRKKVVVHLHIGNQINEVTNNKLYQNMFKGADAIIVLSQSIRQKLEHSFNLKDKVHVIYNPCPQVTDVKYSDESKQILFAGFLNKNKGYSILIQAFAKIATSFPDWKLVVAGSGELEEAKALVDSLHINTQVIFPGWVRGLQKETCFRRASVFCLASFAEGFPMAVLDAWSYGLPIVSTPVGGLPDVLSEGKNVLFFEPGNITELANRLKQILSDRDLRYRFSEESLSLSKGLFSRDKINEQIESLYNSLSQNE